MYVGNKRLLTFRVGVCGCFGIPRKERGAFHSLERGE